MVGNGPGVSGTSVGCCWQGKGIEALGLGHGAVPQPQQKGGEDP